MNRHSPRSTGRVRIALVVARTELRRTVRTIAGNWTKVVLFAVAALFVLGPVLTIGTLTMVRAGEAIAAGNQELPGQFTATGVVTGGVAIGQCVLILTAAMRAAVNVADLDEPNCVLVSTSVSSLVAGLVVAEFVLFSLWILPPVLVLSGAFAYGLGTVTPLLVAPLVVGLVVGVGVSVGLVAGIGIRHAVTTYEPIAAYRTPLLVAVSVGYVGLIALGLVNPIVDTLYDLLGDSPVGWPGHLLLLAIPGLSSSPIAVVGSILGTGLVLVTGQVLGTRGGSVHWFADPPETDEKVVGAAYTTRTEVLLARLVSRPVRAGILTTLRRARRAPIRLLYVVYPLFGAFYIVEDVARAGTVPSYVAVLLCLYLVWAAGVLFTLNPLGDFGPTLPTVLTTPVSGRDALLGSVLASVLVATPFGLVTSSVVTVISPLSTRWAATLVGLTVVGSLATPALAAGIGTLFPRFGSVRVAANRREVMPSKTAFVVYSVTLLVPTGALVVLVVDGIDSLLATTATALLGLFPGVSISVPVSLVTALASVVVALGVIAPVLSVTYAIRKFERYRPF